MVSNLGHSWQNVINANGISMTIVGMLIVFFSLTIISLIIGSTPLFLKVLNKYIPETGEETYSKNNGKNVSDAEIVAAISTALTYSMQAVKNK